MHNPFVLATGILATRSSSPRRDLGDVRCRWGRTCQRLQRQKKTISFAVVLAMIVVMLQTITQIPFLLLAGWGFVCVGFLFMSQLLVLVVTALRPELANCYGPERLELLLHYLQTAGPYDFVCLQEFTVVWGRAAFRDQFAAKAADIGFRHAVWSTRWPQFPALYSTNGLGLLSRHPINPASVRKLAYREQSGVDWPILRRGALFATIQIPEVGQVDVLTLHTTSSVETLSAGMLEGNSLGCRQAREALNWFTSLSSKGHEVAVSSVGNPILRSGACSKGEEDMQLMSVSADAQTDQKSQIEAGTAVLRVFCGDFNFEKDTHSFQTLSTDCHQVCLFDAVPNCEATFGNVDVDGNPCEWLLTFSEDRGRPRVLDHVFSNFPAEAARVVAMPNFDCNSHHLYQQVSDHCGVEVTFKM